MQNHLISLMLLLPFVGALSQASATRAKWMALISSLGSSLCGIILVVTLGSHSTELHAIESLSWIGSYAIHYSVGVDGMSALPLLLISILFPILITAEWERREGTRGIHALFLLLQTACVGVACSHDLFLLFMFFAFSSVPAYFLVGIWGGKQREIAASRLVATSAISNALLFSALVLIYYSVDPHTLSIAELSAAGLESKTFQLLGHDLSVAQTAFALLSFGIALRAPLWPLHGWYTRVAEEAPPSVFVALSSVVVPLTLYVYSRLSYSLFPGVFSHVAPVIVVVGVVNLVVGGLSVLAQRGLRLLIAYLCMSEVGLLLLGLGSLTREGVVGAVFQEFASGLALAGFGLLYGIVLERTGEARFLNDQGKPSLGGIATLAPGVAAVAGIVMASLLGLPGFSGFVGHALLMMGTYPSYPVVVIMSVLVLVLITYWLFSVYRWIFFGEAKGDHPKFMDLSLREKSYLLPIVVGLVVFGLYPGPMIELIRPTVLTLLSAVK